MKRLHLHYCGRTCPQVARILPASATARSVWSAWSLLPLSATRPEQTAPASWTHSIRFALLNCITIKSGRDADGRRVGRPAENYTISNCTMADGHGGVVIGSEMSGGVKNITIANCVFDGTERGVAAER